jgi:hypothetical protein
MTAGLRELEKRFEVLIKWIYEAKMFLKSVGWLSCPGLKGSVGMIEYSVEKET